MTTDATWLAKHQFVTAVESGIDAAQKIKQAAEDGLAQPATRQPLNVENPETFAIVFKTAEEVLGLSAAEIGALFGASAASVTDWAQQKNLPEPEQRIGLVQGLCNGLRKLRNQQMKPN